MLRYLYQRGAVSAKTSPTGLTPLGTPDGRMQLKTHAEAAYNNGAFMARTYKASSPRSTASTTSTTKLADRHYPPIQISTMSSSLPPLESGKVQLPDGLQLHVTSYTDMDMNDDDPQHIRDDHVDIIIGIVVAFVVVLIAIIAFFCSVRPFPDCTARVAIGVRTSHHFPKFVALPHHAVHAQSLLSQHLFARSLPFFRSLLSSLAFLPATCAHLSVRSKAAMGVRRIRRAQLGGAGETSSFADSRRSRTTTTHNSASGSLPAFASTSVSDPVSSGPTLHIRHHDDKDESRTTKIVAGTAAGAGMLLLGGLVLIWYMVWKQRRRRNRERARQQARCKADSSDPLTVEQPVIITPFPMSEPANSPPRSPPTSMRTHLSDPGPGAHHAKPFAYLQTDRTGKLGYPSSPAATRPQPKRASTELVTRDELKQAQRHSTIDSTPYNGRRRSHLPPPVMPSILGSPTSSTHTESPHLTPIENVRLPPWPPSERRSLEQVARASLQMDRASISSTPLQTPRSSTGPLPPCSQAGTPQVGTPIHTPRSSTGPLPPQLSPRAPHQPLPAVPRPQRTLPQQPVHASPLLIPRQNPDVSTRPFSYPPSVASYTPPSSRGPSPLAPRGPSPHYPSRGTSPSFAPPGGGPPPPRQLSLPAPLGVLPPSAYPNKRYSVDQLPARGTQSTTVQSLPFGARPARTPSPGRLSDRHKRGSEEILVRRASEQDLLAAARMGRSTPSPSGLRLVTARTPSPGGSSISSSSWPLPTPLNDPANTPPVRGRPLPGTPTSAPATPTGTPTATPGTPTLIPATTGQSTGSISRPLPVPPPLSSPTQPKSPLPQIPDPVVQEQRVVKDKSPVSPTSMPSDQPPPYSYSPGEALPEKTRGPNVLSRTASGSRQACVYKPSARPGQQYAL
ncbi:hypothetical protein A1Q1_06499 [Trichosporon asahii var. asahii CBS 2479]|uniref:Uncharacterized protein n=1 Tax=Trichosporon asahii var. asahii (strain ATCC 90039 / CBS 2479 / JCM 2466 / KCTC 7840 / NBRC 103889/ NCYC 2677 / UAMH 7654) TaxID=1186058 RepID=J5SDC4_TRIAS|nr:hypothetical protein A1Q1_06499 [Trichosporon asahii var. asahii CBS 2479]EJT45091.1 hypothetical protein A1Q1_06499 [Trichosporon asahii var. asahii CBS 2479]